jgi:adenine-specific DNA-methyltransferase
MIYPRLKLARDLLTDDGVIFISIDDNEQANLKKLCDNEVFGEDNFIATIIWERAFAPKNDSKYLSENHDYILMYVKNKDYFNIGKLDRTQESINRYKNYDNDLRGPWTSDNLTAKTYSVKYDYPITVPSGRIINPAHGSCWRVSKKRFDELVAEHRIWFGEDGNNVPRLKRFLSEVQHGMTPTTLFFHKDFGHNQEGRQEIKDIFDGKGYFDGPKPVRLMSKLLKIANLSNDSIVLDFFSGSATTAHAVMQLNAENNGNRKFIMVQWPEETPEDSEARKADYKTICEIGKERIRRAGKKITYENRPATSNLDIGFRVLKIDSSNMKPVFYNPKEVSQDLLSNTESNIKEDRTPEDLLFQVMLDMGVDLASQITVEQVDDKKIFIVGGNDLICCFDNNVTKETVTEIAKRKPLYAVFRDSGFERDDVMISFDQIFETYSPATERRII